MRQTGAITQEKLLSEQYIALDCIDPVIGIDANLGSYFYIILTRDITLSVFNYREGRLYIRLEQDPVGGHTVSFDGSFRSAPIVASAASAVSWIELAYDPLGVVWDVNPTPDLSGTYVTAAALSAAVVAALQLVYPVGVVLLSVKNTAGVPDNPATWLGFGTWSLVASGRTIVGLDSGDTDFDTLEETGGSKTVTPTATFTGSPLSSHSHTFTQSENAATPDLVAEDTSGSGVAAKGTTSSDSAGTPAGSVTVNAASIVQPYFVTAIWQRTA